tara:strand:+ start:103 stop:951 length:849 start_codon:yes stop_codon:yes gene_type:complete
MRSRILKRPMFRMGGDVENTGIMDGMRNRYAKSDPKGVQPRRDPMLFTPSLNDFLIQFGLNLASGTPRGNIFATAAEAAKDPFAVMQAKIMRGVELESDRDFKRELLAEELKGKKEIAEIGQNIKNYDTYLKFGIDQYNDMVKAENYANFMTNTKPRIDADFGGTQFGGFIEQDITKENVKNKFIKNNAGKIGSVFFDLNTNQLFQLKRIDNEGNVDLVPTSITNMKDIEGTTMPEPKKPEDKTKDNVEAYQKMVSEDFRKKREERAKELEKKFGVEDDVDI